MNQTEIYSLNTYRAKRLVEDGKFLISEGDLDRAAAVFKESIAYHPNTEAYTHLGWVLSLKGNLDEAIELCRKALKLEPDLGNPYNDIGSYLIQKGYLDDAISWLEKAKSAERYELRHFPHINLGRVYTAQGKFEKAYLEFQEALKIVPAHEELRRVITELEKLRNSQI